ncbi:hypothetical protein B566_EDAN007325 [Ephemera danica]|nr:hypothetical protein B566_EDAN007325 [Ephemera danica]
MYSSQKDANCAWGECGTNVTLVFAKQSPGWALPHAICCGVVVTPLTQQNRTGTTVLLTTDLLDRMCGSLGFHLYTNIATLTSHRLVACRLQCGNVMPHNLLLLLFLCAAVTARTSVNRPLPVQPQRIGDECRVSLKDGLPRNQPLLIRSSTKRRDHTAFLMPDTTGILHVPQGEGVLLACPGRDNQLANLGLAETVVQCQGGETFVRSGKQFVMKDFNCTSFVSHSARRNTTARCEVPGDFIVIDVGYQLRDGSFYTLMQTCFDERNRDAVYAKFVQTPVIEAAQHGEQRPIFIEGEFYPDVNVNSKYVRDGQRNTMSQILGSNELGAKYIGEGDYYLARGHLVARADFVFSSHQRATFWYVNVAPQWQTFNGGNWNTLEANVRKFTASQDRPIVIYTGTHGTLSFPDASGTMRPLFLHIDERTGAGKIRVPQYFWKVLYEPQSRRGVAFVAINNPYEANFTPLCHDVCASIPWIKWQAKKQKLGFGNCCEVAELRRTITTIPNLNVAGLLS